MISYLIELGIIHSVLIFGYWVFLKKESQYAKVRGYLIVATLLALAVPLLNLPSLLTLFQKSTNEPEAFAIMLQPVNFTGLNEKVSDSDDINLLYMIYGLISIGFFLKFLYNIASLISLERKSEYQRIADVYVRKIADLPGTFTFFHWIFVSKDIENEGDQYLPIIRHEQAHAHLGHSYDLLLIELLKIIAWWLPTSWFVQKEIKKIHEYQADAYALKSYSIDQYSSILISSTLKINGLSLASSFHDGLILKRLKAMKQTVKQIKPWKLGVLGILTALLVITFACNEQLDEDLKEISENAYQTTNLPESAKKILEMLEKEHPNEEFRYVEVMVKGNPDALAEKLEEMDLDRRFVAAVDMQTDKGILGVFLREGKALDYASEKTIQEGDVYTIVEQQPTYPGGMGAFYTLIADNITYPKQAREANISGRVYVQFVVEKDGSLSEMKVVKGIGGGCDEEAIRVLQMASAFNPGMQRGKPVRVRMVMPIIFQFSDQSVAERKKPEGESLEDVIVVGKTDILAQKMTPEAAYNNGVWKGTVYDDAGEPLAGVNIVAEGTTSGTISDREGKFSLKADKDTDLLFSFVGFQSAKVSNK